MNTTHNTPHTTSDKCYESHDYTCTYLSARLQCHINGVRNDAVLGTDSACTLYVLHDIKKNDRNEKDREDKVRGNEKIR